MMRKLAMPCLAAAAFCFVSTAVGACDGGDVELSPQQFAPFSLALKQASKHRQQIGKCKVVIETDQGSVEGSIEVSFLSPARRDLYQIGAIHPVTLRTWSITAEPSS
jgi:hypothetical protein